MNIHLVSDYLSEIIIRDKRKNGYYGKYKTYKKRNFWGVHIGYGRCMPYSYGDEYSISLEEGLKLYLFIDGYFYYKPTVTFIMNNGNKYELEYETLELAIATAEKVEFESGKKIIKTKY